MAKSSHLVVLPPCPGSHKLPPLPYGPSSPPEHAAQWVLRVQCFFCSQTRHSTYSSPTTVSKQTTQCWSKQLETGIGLKPGVSQSTGLDNKLIKKCPRVSQVSQSARSVPSLVAGVVASPAADGDHGLKVNVKSGHLRPWVRTLHTIYHVKHVAYES